MYVYIYCFDKGLFKKKKYVKALKRELSNEFGGLEKESYILADKFTCHIDKDYSSYVCIYETSDDSDRLINALIRVSERFTLLLSCTLSKETESDLVMYFREKVKGRNISVTATLRI